MGMCFQQVGDRQVIRLKANSYKNPLLYFKNSLQLLKALVRFSVLVTAYSYCYSFQLSLRPSVIVAPARQF